MKISKESGNLLVGFLIGLVALAAGLLVFFLSLRSGRLFTGVEYAGHGFWGGAALFVTCMFFVGTLSIIAYWLFGLTPGKKPLWKYFIPGVVFLVLFLAGIARHLPCPILMDLLLALLSWAGIYFGLYGEWWKK